MVGRLSCSVSANGVYMYSLLTVGSRRIFPAIIRATLGVVAIGTRRYIDWALVLHRYALALVLPSPPY